MVAADFGTPQNRIKCSAMALILFVFVAAFASAQVAVLGVFAAAEDTAKETLEEAILTETPGTPGTLMPTTR
jgi:hypothetical protein